MDIDIGSFTSEEYYQRTLSKQDPRVIPWWVRLLENPDSSLPFPGQIYLKQHDYLHTIFHVDQISMGEVFLVGFFMSSDPLTKAFYLTILKFVAKWIYPKKYKFNEIDMAFLDIGFEMGRQPKYQVFNRMDFSSFQGQKVSDLRKRFALRPFECEAICSRPETQRYYRQDIGGSMLAYPRAP